MRKNENLLRSCNYCECYEIACEEHCVFELVDDRIFRPSLLKKRKAMKAEQNNAVQKATILLRSAKRKKGQKNLYEQSKRSYIRADKDLLKKQQRRNKRIEKNHK